MTGPRRLDPHDLAPADLLDHLHAPTAPEDTMRTAGEAITASRQIAFYAPADMGGKWHARWLVSGTPVCGAHVTLGDTDVIRSIVGASVHPLCCRRCQRLTLPAGVTATGVAR